MPGLANAELNEFDKGSEFRLAFGSCIYQWAEQSIWKSISAYNPDIFIIAGDAIYADWDGSKAVFPTRESLARDWDKLANNRNFKTFRSQTRILGIWDNHDFGTNDSGQEFNLRDESKNLFLNFLQEPESSKRRSRPGVYADYYKYVGDKRIQIILLDTRTFRDEPEKDMRSDSVKKELGIVGHYLKDETGSLKLLGDAQWQWLEDKLSEPADLRIIVSSIQVIPNEKGMDEWGNYPLERGSLLRLLANSQERKLLLLSGNVHFAEISKLVLGEKEIVEFTSSGMTHTSEVPSVFNPFRVGKPISKENFGIVIVKPEAEGVSLSLKIESVG